MYIDSVSVIIATNRESPFIQQAVTSVIRQTVPVGEIILVDDGAPVDLTPFARANGLVYHRRRPPGCPLPGMPAPHAREVRGSPFSTMMTSGARDGSIIS